MEAKGGEHSPLCTSGLLSQEPSSTHEELWRPSTGGRGARGGLQQVSALIEDVSRPLQLLVVLGLGF